MLHVIYTTLLIQPLPEICRPVDAYDGIRFITGFQLSAGIEIDLGRSGSLTPVIKYNNLSRYLDTEGESMDIRYNYLTVRIGILKIFWQSGNIPKEKSGPKNPGFSSSQQLGLKVYFITS